MLVRKLMCADWIDYWTTSCIYANYRLVFHTGDFPRGVGHRVKNGWGLTKVAVVLLNGVLMVKKDIYPKTTLIYGHFEL